MTRICGFLKRLMLPAAAFLLCLEGIAPHAAFAAASDHFKIACVDEETGRGIPLVELRTVNNIKSFTDSNGLIAFNEPGLMGRKVFFHVQSHGYEFPKDGFGNRGVALTLKAGGSAVIKLHRVNIAERLYRVTGAGIYRDTVLLGEKPPTEQPVINGDVFGQDTVITAVFKNQVYWFWGDTDRPGYPLGNFSVSGATSQLPGKGGLDPKIGVNLHYFTNSDGFTRKMLLLEGPGLVWIEGVFTVTNSAGRELLAATYTRQRGLVPPEERGVALFDESAGHFKSAVVFRSREGHDSAHPFKVHFDGREYIYIFPEQRVLANWESVTNESSWESFTCLNAAGSPTEVARAPDGLPSFSWRASFPRFTYSRQSGLIKAGEIKPVEALWQLTDLDSSQVIGLQRGSVTWNPFLGKWLMLCGGFGSVWISQADTPTGPWIYAKKIVSHDHYNFYNPTQHPFFDAEGGAHIFFEGTYTTSFTDAPEKTPRYDYNQIMYSLSLKDDRTVLPSPVYQIQQDGRTNLLMQADVERNQLWRFVTSIPFFAFSENRAPKDSVSLTILNTPQGPRFQSGRGTVPGGIHIRLPGKKAPGTLLLNPMTSGGFSLVAETDSNSSGKEPWRVFLNPMTILPLDFGVVPSVR